MRVPVLAGCCVLVGVWLTVQFSVAAGRATAHRTTISGLGVESGSPPPWASVSEMARRLSSRRGAAIRSAWPILAVGALASLLAQTVVPLLIVAGPVGLAESLGSLRRRRERDRFDAAIPRFAEGVARSLRSGTSLSRALWDGAESVGEPIEAGVAEVRRRVDGGESLGAALQLWATEHPFDDLCVLVVVCTIGAQVGGQLASSFEGCATSMRTRREVSAELRAMSSQARASMIMLAALPFGVAAFMSALDQGVARFLLETASGALCLGVAAALDAVGFLWMRAMVRSAW